MLLQRNPIQSSYWLGKGLLNPWSRQSTNSDILIIGTGISASSIAYHMSLIDPTKRITLLDARGIAGGATGRNGGLLWPSLPDRWPNLVSSYGPEESLKLLKFSMLNVEAIKSFVGQLNAEVYNPELHQFDGALHLMELSESLSEWKNEISDMKAAGGVLDIETWTSDRVYNAIDIKLKFQGAVVDKVAYKMRPAYLVWHLLNESSKRMPTFAVHTDTVVQGTKRTENGHKIYTTNGEYETKTLVYCTEAATNDILPSARITPIKNQVLVTKPIKGGIPFNYSITANDGYQYMSPREDGRIVIGGFRDLVNGLEIGNSNDGSMEDVVTNAQVEFLKRNFPSLGDIEVEHKWAGIMGWTADKLPYVGSIGDNRYVCLGFGGHGMPRCFLSGKAVANMIAGNSVGDDFPTSFLPTNRFGKMVGKISFESKF